MLTLEVQMKAAFFLLSAEMVVLQKIYYSKMFLDFSVKSLLPLYRHIIHYVFVTVVKGEAWG